MLHYCPQSFLPQTWLQRRASYNILFLLLATSAFFFVAWNATQAHWFGKGNTDAIIQDNNQEGIKLGNRKESTHHNFFRNFRERMPKIYFLLKYLSTFGVELRDSLHWFVLKRRWSYERSLIADGTHFPLHCSFVFFYLIASFLFLFSFFVGAVFCFRRIFLCNAQAIRRKKMEAVRTEGSANSKPEEQKLVAR